MNILLKAYEYWKYENINKKTFQTLDNNRTSFAQNNTSNEIGKSAEIDNIGEGDEMIVPNNKMVQRWGVIISSPLYELCVNLIGIINVSSIVIRQTTIASSTKYITYWMYL